MSDSTPEARIAEAEAAEERALLKLATAYKARNAAYKDVSRAAYREGGTTAQFNVGTRLGPDRHAKALVRRLRRLGLGLLLDHTRVG